MPEFLTLLPPEEARRLLLSHMSGPINASEELDVPSALGRILFEDIHAPHPLPEFQRSTVDGYAVDIDDRITFVNEFLVELSGFSRDELIGQRWTDVFTPDEGEARSQALAFAEQLAP